MASRAVTYTSLFILGNGTSKTLDVSRKWSGAIFEELMNSAGGDRWQAFRAERKAAGKELVFPTMSEQQPQVKKEGVAAALP